MRSVTAIFYHRFQWWPDPPIGGSRSLSLRRWSGVDDEQHIQGCSACPSREGLWAGSGGGISGGRVNIVRHGDLLWFRGGVSTASNMGSPDVWGFSAM